MQALLVGILKKLCSFDRKKGNNLRYILTWLFIKKTKEEQQAFESLLLVSRYQHLKTAYLTISKPTPFCVAVSYPEHYFYTSNICQLKMRQFFTILMSLPQLNTQRLKAVERKKKLLQSTLANQHLSSSFFFFFFLL